METVIRIGGQTLSFTEGKAVFELAETRNCVVKPPCRMTRKTRDDIIKIDDSKIIAINTNLTHLNSTCDSRVFNLHGHYYIQFNNCTIQLGNIVFKNRLVRFEQSFAIPSKVATFSSEKPLIFEDIILNQESNIRRIDELHFHKHVVTAIGTTTIVLLACLLITVIILCKRQGEIKVKVTGNRITRAAASNSMIRQNFATEEASYANN